MAQRDLICVYQYLRGECKEDRAGPFSVAPGDRRGGRRQKFNSWNSLKTSKTLGCEDGWTLQQAAQRGHGVSSPEMFKPAWTCPSAASCGTCWERVGAPASCIPRGGLRLYSSSDNWQTNQVKLGPSSQNDKNTSTSFGMKNSCTSRNLLQKVTSIIRYSEILSTRFCNPSLPQVN